MSESCAKVMLVKLRVLAEENIKFLKIRALWYDEIFRRAEN